MIEPACERLDAFMARANARYYATCDPFRDFTTSPEISQVFGELLGLWAAVTWDSMGRPDPVILAEAGPGRGTLMQDALRAVSQRVPDFRAALRLHLVETSPRLRAVQAERLHASWHDRIEDVPPGPMILLANEFLDALPIRQFVRRAGRWMERHVAGGAFVERDAPDEFGDSSDGSVVERCDVAQGLVRHLALRLGQDGGAALFLDYGPETQATGDSLQALRDGKPSDPLADPGTADLTAHVDFAALVAAATPLQVAGPVPQGLFLARLGLFQRIDRLARGQSPQMAMQLIESARRLAEPHAMGRLFKALALCHPSLSKPPGFSV
jgi:SAM-dependent MidA family methyltransferase